MGNRSPLPQSLVSKFLWKVQLLANFNIWTQRNILSLNHGAGVRRFLWTHYFVYLIKIIFVAPFGVRVVQDILYTVLNSALHTITHILLAKNVFTSTKIPASRHHLDCVYHFRKTYCQMQRLLVPFKFKNQSRYVLPRNNDELSLKSSIIVAELTVAMNIENNKFFIFLRKEYHSNKLNYRTLHCTKTLSDAEYCIRLQMYHKVSALW